MYVDIIVGLYVFTVWVTIRYVRRQKKFNNIKNCKPKAEIIDLITKDLVTEPQNIFNCI